ncbi:MAG: hypothetical protein FWE44_00385 [Defluviitaleaceae bacterium]|nr:hypothetical protein [Defluviitaleaceae bacterium]
MGLNIVPMFKGNWGKLPYPKFLETSLLEVWVRGEVVADGQCYFGYRVSARREADGVESRTKARATSCDAGLLQAVLAYDLEEMEFGVCRGGDGYTMFLVEELRVVDNPDGSFNHVYFGLVDAVGGRQVAAPTSTLSAGGI